MSAAPRIPNNLPTPVVHVTTHDQTTGKAVVHSSRTNKPGSFDKGNFTMTVMYSTSEFPVELADEKDIGTHDSLMESGKLGLVNPNGTVCRVVDFAPGNTGIMHRTASLDYGIVLAGELDMLLDSGETRRMKPGDIAVQRATMHAWRNASPDTWARMVFVLQDCKPVSVAGVTLGEDLSGGAALLTTGAGAKASSL